MSVESVILAAFFNWLQADLSLTDAQLIFLDQGAPRPAKPYLGIGVLTLDAMVGMDDELQSSLDGSDDPQVRTKGQRRATVEVQGFGAATADWLAESRLAMNLPEAQAIFDAAGITVVPKGGATADNPRVDTILEDRYLLEFDVFYALASSYQSQSEATEMAVGMTYESTPDDVTGTITIEGS